MSSRAPVPIVEDDRMKALVVVCAVFSCVFSGAALAVSLTHHGPAGPPGSRGVQGPAGPQGQTGHNAEVAHLGVCVQTQTSTDGSVTWITSVYPAVVTDGVPSCPSGSFTSIVPQASQG